jgi:hypothetical protein
MSLFLSADIISIFSVSQHAASRLRNAAQCLDLLETCWTLERARLLRDDQDVSEQEDCVSETESEPGPERGDLEVTSGMGQRASSTSSLHVKPPTTTAPGRVSLTWALLKRQPSVHTTQPQQPLVQRRASPVRSGVRSNRATPQPTALLPEPESPRITKQSTTSSHVTRNRSNRTSESSSVIKRFGYDIHDVDEFLSKVNCH